MKGYLEILRFFTYLMVLFALLIFDLALLIPASFIVGAFEITGGYAKND